MSPWFEPVWPSASFLFQSVMMVAAIPVMRSWVASRGCSSQRQATVEACEGSSSRPKTVVAIPAMGKVFLETCGGSEACVFAIGSRGFAM